MLILGMDTAGLPVTVTDLEDIDQIDWTVGADGEYRYAFLLFGDDEPVAILGRSLADDGRMAIAVLSL